MVVSELTISIKQTNHYLLDKAKHLNLHGKRKSDGWNISSMLN